MSVNLYGLPNLTPVFGIWCNRAIYKGTRRHGGVVVKILDGLILTTSESTNATVTLERWQREHPTTEARTTGRRAAGVSGSKRASVALLPSHPCGYLAHCPSGFRFWGGAVRLFTGGRVNTGHPSTPCPILNIWQFGKVCKSSGGCRKLSLAWRAALAFRLSISPKSRVLLRSGGIS